MQYNHHYNTSANQAEQPMPKERILDSPKQSYASGKQKSFITVNFCQISGWDKVTFSLQIVKY